MTVEVLSAPPSPLAVFSRALLSTTKRDRAPRLPAKSLVLERVVTDPAYSTVTKAKLEGEQREPLACVRMQGLGPRPSLR